MAEWLVATLRRYLGCDAYVDNPVHVYLTGLPQISASDPVSLRRGAHSNFRPWIGAGSHSFPALGIWNPRRNGNTALTIFGMVIILLFSTSEIPPWPTF